MAKKKARSPYVDELRDPRTYISTENHMEVFRRLLAALNWGIHNKPGEPHKKHKKS